MRSFLLILSCIVAVSAVSHSTPEATVYYVRTDGNNDQCTGLMDAPAPVPCSMPPCDCAYLEIWKGISVLMAGDTLRIRSGRYNENLALIGSGSSQNQITIEGIGTTKPVIGKIHDFNEEAGWTLHDDATKTYRRAITGTSLWAAYIDFAGKRPYENERVGLVPYPSLLWLMATSEAYSPTAPYYVGPGAVISGGNLYVRLQPTNRLSDYESKYLDLFLPTTPPELSTNPSQYRIIISTETHQLRVNGSWFVFRNLYFEPAKRTIELCSSEGSSLDHVTFDNLTVWIGNDGGIRSSALSSCSEDNITIVNSRIYGDVPYWVSWGDCKINPASSRACDLWRMTSIGMFYDDDNWVIANNHLRGGHDGIGTNDDGQSDNIEVRYNRIENFADDPIEIESGPVGNIGQWKIFGNFIGNSLNCIAPGQDSSSVTGPIYFYSNICVLTRIPHVARDAAQQQPWNGFRDYGNEHAFKAEEADVDPHLPFHVYNNTIVLVDSEASTGMDNIPKANSAGMGTQHFNNIFVKVNQRVGQELYPTDPNVVNWNLYFRMNDNPSDMAPLLDTHPTVGPTSTICTSEGWECKGVGSSANRGTDPQFNVHEGFGFPPEFDKTLVRWSVDPGSQFWDPGMFVPGLGSPVCNVGRSSDPNSSFPSNFPNDPVLPGLPFDAADIGGIPCDASVNPSLWNVEPFNMTWKTTSLASGVAPNGIISQPCSNCNRCICNE